MELGEAGREALARAMRRATESGHKALTPGHILLAVVEDGGCREVLEAGGPGASALRNRVEEVLPPAGRRREVAALPYTAAARTALRSAEREAEGMGATSVSPLHLLLGLFEVEDERIPVLTAVGLELGAVREAVRRHLGLAPKPPAYLRLDRSSDDPLYEQIEWGIKEAVASGELVAGARLPTVRGLAASLSVAPGTVARAYRRLESDGVVETAGARGTRVAERGDPPDEGAVRAQVTELLRPALVAAYHTGAARNTVRGVLDELVAALFADR